MPNGNGMGTSHTNTYIEKKHWIRRGEMGIFFHFRHLSNIIIIILVSLNDPR
jgi:hypothetical protein